MRTSIRLSLLAASLLAAPLALANPDVVRLGNLKFAHYGAVSYMKDYCGKYNLKVEERMFPKGPDIMPAIVAEAARKGSRPQAGLLPGHRVRDAARPGCGR